MGNPPRERANTKEDSDTSATSNSALVKVR